VARHDRLHARPPSHDTDRWTEGRVVDVTHDHGSVVVTVRAAGATDDPVDLRVSDAVYGLFVERVDPEDRTDGEVTPGAPVWFRVRGQSGRP
jgi:hypothetical protein